MSDRFSFPPSAAGYYAMLVIDNYSGHQIAGTITVGIDGNYTYTRAFWHGSEQGWDTFSAPTLDELASLIEDYVDGEDLP